MAEKDTQAKNPQTMTSETAAAIELLARSLKPQGPLEQAGLDQATIDALTKPPAPKKYRMIAGKSEETGATFTMHVVESKRFPNGRIVALAGYAHPDGMLTYQANGGRVPDGLQITKNGSGGAVEGATYQKHDLSNEYLQWRWSSFWQVDLRRYVGRELQAHFCATPEGLKTPWLDGHVGKLRDDEEG